MKIDIHSVMMHPDGMVRMKRARVTEAWLLKLLGLIGDGLWADARHPSNFFRLTIRDDRGDILNRFYWSHEGAFSRNGD